MDELFKFKLGTILRDIVTGFRGVAMGRTQYFTGCTHYGLCSRTVTQDKSKMEDWVWIDESRLTEVKGSRPVVFQNAAPTSGPHPNPPRRHG